MIETQFPESAGDAPDFVDQALHENGGGSGRAPSTPWNLQWCTMDEFLKLELPPRQLILDPWLPARGLAMIYSERGMGKTLLALSLSYAISTGTDVLGFSCPLPRRLLYIDGEMPARPMKERLAALQRPETSGQNFRLLNSERTDRGIPDLSTLEGQRILDDVIGDAEVVVLDNISTLVRSGKENEAEGWAPVQEWALNHRRAGRCIMFIHHASKAGRQRGTSKREDVLDTVIALKHPADYVASEGARFELHFEKARAFFGQTAEPFEARYETTDGLARWTRTSLRDGKFEEAARLFEIGVSIRGAADKLDITKSQAETMHKRWKKQPS